MGHARATIGELAYHFDPHSPIALGDERWRHLIDMDWDETFVPFRYEHPRAAPNTVLELNRHEVQTFDQETQVMEHRDRGLLTDEEVQGTLLLETQYPRYSPAARRLIRRQHAAMSNNFTLWLRTEFGLSVTQERQQIDAMFEIGGRSYLVEFKIAYQGDTKRAIREALGQILEYNHYPSRISHDHWLLVLNTTPCKEDIIFLGRLRAKFSFPLTLGWKTDHAFTFEPPLSF